MRQLLLLLLLQLPPLLLWPCSCGPFPLNFCQNMDGGETIVAGTVLEHYTRQQIDNPSSGWVIPIMDFRIEVYLHGEVLAADTVSIIGQDGLNCNAWIDDFDPGLRMIIAFPAWTTQNENWPDNFETPNFPAYPLFGCGIYFLRILEDEQVSGPILPGVNGQSLEEFTEGLSTCLLSSNTREVSTAGLRAFPNPAQHAWRISNETHSTQHLSLYNAQGARLMTLQLAPGEQRELPANELPPGIYWLKDRPRPDQYLVLIKS